MAGFKKENMGLHYKIINDDCRNLDKYISEIVKFKEDQNYIDAIVQFSVEQNLKVRNIIIGVGFGHSRQMLTKLSECGIDKVDYFLVISENLDTWKIFSNTDVSRQFGETCENLIN